MSSVTLLLLLMQPAAVQVQAEPMPGCALDARLHEALERVLPGLEILRAPQPLAADDLILAVSRKKKRLNLQLTNAAGRLLLERTVLAKRRGCTATVDTIALMVERYLRDLGWEPMNPVLPAAALAPPASVAEPEPAEPTPDERPAVKEEAQAPAVPWWSGLAMSAAAITEISRAKLRWRGGAAATVALPLENIDVMVELGGFAPHTKPVIHLQREAGTYDIWSLHSRVGLDACWPSEGPRGCGALLLGAELFVASAAGELVIDESRSVFFVPSGSAAFRFVYPFWHEAWSLFASVSVLGRPWTDTFLVEGATSSYTPSPLAFWGAIGVSMRFH